MREYRTYFHKSQSWRVNESTADRIIHRIEETLLASRAFALPGKKQIQKVDAKLEVVVVDVTETPLLSSKKNKSDSSVGKRKIAHLSHKRSEIFLGEKLSVLLLNWGESMSCEYSRISKVRPRVNIACLGDRGDRERQKLHHLSRTAKKKPRGGKLTRADKKSNQALAKLRIIGEHIHRKLKIFRILSKRDWSIHQSLPTSLA